MTQKIFSEKTQTRIDSLKHMLQAYEKSILRLNDFAEGKLTLRNKRYTYAAECYKRTKRDEQRLPSTINNIKSQMRLYQHELEVLQEYGN
jgi:hypothetical protein